MIWGLGFKGGVRCAHVAVLMVIIAAEFISAADVRALASTEPGWPQFRGPRRDGVSDERGLLQQWPPTGPKVVWSVTNIGHGYSSPVISGERLIITGDVDEKLVLFAFDLSGKALWTATNGAFWKDPYPGARASATFSGGRLYQENANGRVACLDAANGRELWSVEVLQKFGGKNIEWGLSECLLVDDRAVFVTAGGSDALVVALDKANGHVLWKSQPLKSTEPERDIEHASYVSPILVQVGSRRVLVGCSLRNLYCVDADTGAIHWTKPMPTSYSVLALTPTLVGDGIFMTAPHGKGGRLWRMKDEGGKITADEVWRSDLDTCQGGVVYRDGKLFGSFYGRKGWAAVDAKTGAILYQAADFVKGAPLYADGRLYALCEDGWMLLLDPRDKEFAVHGKFRFVDARKRDAWAHTVVLNGRLYLRYNETLTCYDIRKP